MSEKTEVREFALPEGRLINENLFEKDAYKDPQTSKEGTAKYKVEIAFDPGDVTGEGTIEDSLIDAACDKWGDGAEDEFLKGDIRTPFLKGDKLAKRREEKGKEGDAYKGKLVIRADTLYNKDGLDAPGGIQVFDEEVNEVGIVNRGAIYPGCMGVVGVTIHCYLDNAGDKSMKFYLSAFQKTGDGERLVASRDRSTMFKPVGRAKSEDGGSGRRSRKG